MATALVTQIAYAVQTLFDPAGTAGRLVDLGKLANYGLLGGAATTVWLPSELFTTGVNGTWYDPSDMTTLFQDAAGTTPVTAVEQPVGLMLDKSGKSPTTWLQKISDPTLSTTTGWSNPAAFSGGKYISGSSSYSLTATIGKLYRYTYIVSTASAGGLALYVCGVQKGSSTPIPAGTYSGTVVATSTKVFEFYDPGWGWTGQIDSVSVEELQGNHAFNPSGNSANCPVLSARYNLYANTETLATQNVTTVATSYKLTFTGSGSITLTGTATGVYTAGSYTISCTAGTLTSTVLGTVTQADIRPANESIGQPAYQRVGNVAVTASDYDTVGFKPYLKFNGTNQWLQTNSIDFSYGDKMFVSAGVRRNTANDGLITENSAASWQYAGAFGLGTIAAGGFFTGLSGSVLGGFGTFSKAAPTTDVLTAAYDIASSVRASESKLRVNGSDVVQTFAGNDAGTGNFGNYPLYIGARGGASMWFNGRIYQLVVAGKQASASEITNTETYLNQKTGAY